MFRRLVFYKLGKFFRIKGLDEELGRHYIRWARYVLEVFDADLTVEGLENIPADANRRLVILSNHQSQLDIPVLVASMDRKIGFVAKRELGRIPILGYFMGQ